MPPTRQLSHRIEGQVAEEEHHVTSEDAKGPTSNAQPRTRAMKGMKLRKRARIGVGSPSRPTSE